MYLKKKKKRKTLMFKPTCGRRPGHLARARALAAAACALVTAPWLFSLFISWLFSNRPSWPPPPWPPSTDVRTPAPDTSQGKGVVKKKKKELGVLVGKHQVNPFRLFTPTARKRFGFTEAFQTLNISKLCVFL